MRDELSKELLKSGLICIGLREHGDVDQSRDSDGCYSVSPSSHGVTNEENVLSYREM